MVHCTIYACIDTDKHEFILTCFNVASHSIQHFRWLLVVTSSLYTVHLARLLTFIMNSWLYPYYFKQPVRKKAGVLTFEGLFIVNLVNTLFDVSNVIHTHYKHLVYAYKSCCNRRKRVLHSWYVHLILWNIIVILVGWSTTNNYDLWDPRKIQWTVIGDEGNGSLYHHVSEGHHPQGQRCHTKWLRWHYGPTNIPK